jgi:hypothetical protein
VFKEIMASKKERHEELLLIEQKLQQLNEERQLLVGIKHNIDERMAKAAEVELLIPLARQLRDLGVDITNFLPYIQTIEDKAIAEKTDLKTAAYGLAQELLEYRQLGSLRRSVGQVHQQMQQAQKQLEMLNMSTAKYQNAIRMLIDLQTAGFSGDQISELCQLVSMWNGVGGRV